MKIIVFGGAGFLGSHVADVLTAEGKEVVIFDKKGSRYLKNGQQSIIGDITDPALVEQAMRGCQVVYNYAGIADIDKAKQLPVEVVKSNILGNTIILEAARKCNIQRYIFASSLYVYSNAGSFYRSSKQACELLIENYQEIFGLDYTILRYGSLYGPRSDEVNWVHKILKQAFVENKITRHGNGEELRDYIHAYDAARLSVNVLGEEFKNQHVIIAGAQPIKIKDLLVMIKEILGNKIELEYKPVVSNEHYEITPYAFSPKLAKRIQLNNYIDLGQGILDLIRNIYQEHCPKELYVKD